MSKYKPHVYVIPEDDADRQLAIGFRLHFAVDKRAISVVSVAGGWLKVLETFETEYIPALDRYRDHHLLMLIDFDEQFEERSTRCYERIPENLKSRVFILGSRNNPEALRREIGMSLESIGTALAQECLDDRLELWRHSHLIHNDAERERLLQIVRKIVFNLPAT